MLPDRVSNPGPLTYESGALPTALCSLAEFLLNLVLDSRRKVLNSVMLPKSEYINDYVRPLVCLLLHV